MNGELSEEYLETEKLLRSVELVVNSIEHGGKCNSDHVTIHPPCYKAKATDINSNYATVSFFVVPLISILPVSVLTFFNPCMSYAVNFRLSLIVPFFVSAGITWIHIAMYDPGTRFCSGWMLRSHLAEEALIFFSLASAIAYINLYTYNFLVIFVILPALFIFSSVFFFIASFWHKHGRFCNESMEEHKNIMNRKPFNADICCRYETIFIGLSLAFAACAGVQLLLPFTYVNELYNNSTRNNPTTEEYCVTY